MEIKKVKKVLGKHKSWIFSGTLHIAFLFIIAAAALANQVAFSPAKLFSARIEMDATSENSQEVKFSPSPLFSRQKIQPVKEEPVPENLPEVSESPEFVIEPVRKTSDITHEIKPTDDLKRLKKIQSGSSSNARVFIPAKPKKEDNANKLPDYPEKARQEGYEGLVVLSVEILEDGSTGKVEVETSSGYLLLDQSAISAVRTWKFTPATVYGSPIKSTIKLPIRFRLT